MEAGAAGGAGVEGGHDFVRLLRIVEEVSPLSFEYGYQREAYDVQEQDGGTAADEDESVTLTGLDGPAGAAGSASPPLAAAASGVAASCIGIWAPLGHTQGLLMSYAALDGARPPAMSQSRAARWC